MRAESKIVIAGGGTGGHVYVALAIADGLVELGVKKNKIVFFGSGRTIENELVPKQGYDLVKFPGRGLNKRELFQNLINIIALKFAVIKAILIFIKDRPKLVVGVGGYASVPAMIGASILRIDRVVHEQNSVMGRTNLIAQKLGAVVLTTFPETNGANSNSKQLGLPLNENVVKAIAIRSEIDFKNRNKKQVVVSGGSLGSVAINEVVVKMVSKYRNEIDFQIIHVCGKNNYESTKEYYSRENCFDKVALHSYRDDLLDLYASSDCVVARSGAGTCVELDALGVPCILIPLASAPGNHQYINGKYLKDRGLATLIEQSNLEEDVLFELLTKRLAETVEIEPNAFNLDSKSRISSYLIAQYNLLNVVAGKNR